MSNNQKVTGLIIALVVLLIVMISVKSGKVNVASIINPSNKTEESSESGSNGTSSEDGNGDSSVSGENDQNNGDSQGNGDSNSDENGGSGGSGDSNSGSGSGSGSGSNANSNYANFGTKDGSITNFSNTKEKVTSNFKASDADIVIQQVKAYSGIYIEDGSDKEVSNVAAIQVKNTSSKPLEFAQIQLYNGKKKLIFDVSTLPANASAVVMEKNKAGFNSSSGVTYGGTTAGYISSLDKASNVKCEKVKNNGIKVTNTSKKDIPCVRIFYKYKSSEGYYVGGITYTAKVENLKAGESQTVYPSHFDSDGGQIMMVKTYTTTD